VVARATPALRSGCPSLLGEAMRRINNEASVSSLFD
jgi:hypothetical protein